MSAVCSAVCSEDIYAQDSIELLKASGLDFSKHEVRPLGALPLGLHPLGS
jgi:hypothetical protein